MADKSLFPLINNLTGKKFNRLLVIGDSGKRRSRNVIWECKCDCGNITEVSGSGLLSNGTKSCGCLNIEKIIERNTIHNMTGTRIHSIWAGMRKRCRDKDCLNYGGRGIKICRRWNKFTNFYNDMKEGYSDNLTIERINNNGNYEPNNCKWVSRYEQSRNQRTNRFITYKNETKILSDWAERLSLSPSTLYYRLKRLQVEQAFTAQKYERL